jgi:hypothetical protein
LQKQAVRDRGRRRCFLPLDCVHVTLPIQGDRRGDRIVDAIEFATPSRVWLSLASSSRLRYCGRRGL